MDSQLAIPADAMCDLTHWCFDFITEFTVCFQETYININFETRNADEHLSVQYIKDVQ